MASDPTAGGAPAEMPVEPSDPNLDIPPKPEGVAAEVEQLQAEKADLQDKLLRALAEAQNVRRRAQQDVERERKFGAVHHDDVEPAAHHQAWAQPVRPSQRVARTG